jgi:phosphate transport system permease protein
VSATNASAGLAAPGTSPRHAVGAPARWRRRKELLIEALVTLVAFVGIAALALILVFVGKEALPLFTDPEAMKEVSLSKLFLPQVVREGRPPAFVWQPVSEVPKVSLVPLLVGTLKTTVVALVLALPVGIASALFVSELAPRRLRGWLKPLVELLAGIPSVVLGFFALMVLASAVQAVTGTPVRLNAFVAGLGLALAIVPVVFTVSEDALHAVPSSYREASLALGATRWETSFKVVLPAAMPGLVAASLLALGRAVGETMIVLMASGNAALVSASLFDSTRSMSATIAAEMGEVVVGSPHYGLLFLIGVVLFALTFVLNTAAATWVRYLNRRVGVAT